ncbi:MAG: pyruvate ferredoxin oxidoreductase [Planctomycetes bacterium]|nr:pyruvate ferredoxin oxidoreductase [Planctomycetota bacterium]MBL7039832.1 pyruvate ferredoxin oxidoreductase [Pirellulaceae bacterium]
MAINLKRMSADPELVAGGHRSCIGCAAPTILRQALHVAGPDTVVCFATGCMEVSTTIYPYTAWRVPYIHCAFENSAATLSGVEAAYRVMKRRGRIPEDKKINFIVFAGDGGTYDIGFQSLSGAMERGHNLLYICYDNNAYMNTGGQRSSATPRGAATMTSPSGKVIPGKQQRRKDMTACMIAHDIPFVAQASVSHHMDFMRKVARGLEVDGPAFINIVQPCHRGWRCKPEDSIQLARVAVETRFWPLYQVDHGQWKVNYKPKEVVPVIEWLKAQGRFKHLTESDTEDIIAWHQEQVETNWATLLEKEQATKAAAEKQEAPVAGA